MVLSWILLKSHYDWSWRKKNNQLSVTEQKSKRFLGEKKLENPKENFSITAHLMGIIIYLSLARFMKDEASHHLHNPLLFGMLMLLIKTLFYPRTRLQRLNKILIFNQYILPLNFTSSVLLKNIYLILCSLGSHWNWKWRFLLKNWTAIYKGSLWKGLAVAFGCDKLTNKEPIISFTRVNKVNCGIKIQ